MNADGGTRLLVFGSNYDALLGQDGKEDVTAPTEYKQFSDTGSVDVASVHWGCSHALARTSDGGVYAWGINDCGALGIGTHVYECEYVHTHTHA
jgi:alpha-tubulin suppressor-like RCC1 family protein